MALVTLCTKLGAKNASGSGIHAVRKSSCIDSGSSSSSSSSRPSTAAAIVVRVRVH
jgi:hypothetical protein